MTALNYSAGHHGVARSNVATSLAAVAAAAALMMIPAIWNGYPLFYFDSVDYVRMPFTWVMPIWRTMPYAMMGLIGKLAGTLWVIPVLQSLAVAWVLHEALASFVRLPPGVTLVPVAALVAALTGLPWFAGEIMADVWASLVILGIATLAFGADRLGRTRSIALTVLVAVGVCFHTSHLAVAAGLVVCLLAMRRLMRGRVPVRVLLPAVSLVGGVAMILAIHWATVGRPFITQPSNILMLGRLVQDGLAKRLLDDACPTGELHLKLCAYRNDPAMHGTANAFLWAPSPFTNLGGWYSPLAEREAKMVMQETLRRYPAAHVLAALKLSAQQFFMLETGDGLVDMREHAQYAMAQYYPDEYISFLKARQHSHHLKSVAAAKRFAAGIDFNGLNALHVPLFLIGLTTMLTLMARWRKRGEWRLLGLGSVVALALLGNAFVCGALSNPNHRYQSRIAWLPILVVSIALVRRVEERAATAVPAGAERAAA